MRKRVHKKREVINDRTTLGHLQKIISRWDKTQFPKGSLTGKANHLIQECGELAESLEKWIYQFNHGRVFEITETWWQESSEELADIVILASSLFEQQGYSIAEAVNRKMAKNILRNWGTPDEKGIIHHVDE